MGDYEMPVVLREYHQDRTAPEIPIALKEYHDG